MATRPPAAIESIAPVDAATFANEIAPRYRPVVIRGLVADWPAVAAGRAGPRAPADYLAPLDGGVPTTVFSAPPDAEGRFFYAPDMRGLNFGTQKVTLTRLLETLVDLADDPAPPGLYAGATPTAQSLGDFAARNPMPLGHPGGEPRIWVGNASRIATHYDILPNIACVVAGRRRFTLFPPDQIANLYVGPVDRTPAGQPVSMVDPLGPDLARYPRFAQAAEHALAADLEPGDAIFIPSLWWHHVRASAPVNVLVNYWYQSGGEKAPFAAMMHALYAIRELPEPERAAWRGWFDHYVFGPDASDAATHLPDHARGVLGGPSTARDETIKAYVAKSLSLRR